MAARIGTTATSTGQGLDVRPFARLPVLGIAAAVGAALLAVAGRFGYFGDELYFLAAARHHAAWGYADNPWLLPQLAGLMDTLFPGSVVGMRILPMLLTCAGVVFAALIAREFGGAARAQALTAAAYALSFQLLASGHLLVTSTVDPFCWVVVSWLVIRWVRIRSDRLLLVAGLVTAVAMQGKFLIAFFWLAVIVGVAIAGPRALLRRPALWAGGAITVLATLPTMLWQAQHGWPYLMMQAVVTEQNSRMLGGAVAMIPLAILAAGPILGSFLACHGVWCLLRRPLLRDYRFLGWATILVILAFLLVAGRYYYVSGLYAALFAASAVSVEQRPPALWWRWVPTWQVCVLSVPLMIYLALPVRPATGFTGVSMLDFVSSGSYGWQKLVDTAATAYRGLSPQAREHTVVMGNTYWQASALDVYGPAEGLPDAYGPERGYWYFGRPPDDTRRVLYVGGTRSQLERFFGEVRHVADVRLETEANTANQGVPVWVCTRPLDPWPLLWKRMHRW